jgi:hypothetical protein
LQIGKKKLVWANAFKNDTLSTFKVFITLSRRHSHAFFMVHKGSTRLLYTCWVSNLSTLCQISMFVK